MNEVQGMILAQGQTISHTRCRNIQYLNGPERAKVPDDKVSWSAEFEGYNPPHHTDPQVLAQPVWADAEECSLQYNKVENGVSRVSHEGVYPVVDGVPLNVVGRTGLSGRGLLGRWGPNHAADPVVTRWKVDSSGNRVCHEKSGKPILEFVCIRRNDTCDWALPGGMVESGDSVTETLKKEFGEEALNTNQMNKDELVRVWELLDELFDYGEIIYQGYVDDPRNTDNAWMETVVRNYHDKSGRFREFSLEAGDDSGKVQWRGVDSSLNLYASHYDYVKTTAETHGAHW